MPEYDPVVVKLIADVAKYNADMQQTARRVTTHLNLQEQSIIHLESQMRKSSTEMAGSLKRVAGAVASYLSVRELMAYSDSFTRLQNNLRVAGLEGQNLKSVQDELFASAQKYGVEIESLSSLYSRLTQASTELGASQAQVKTLTDSVSAALKISGQSSQAASGALLQLGQLFQGPIVQAQEYNSLIDGMYPLLQAAAAGSERWGGSVAKLTAEVKKGDVATKDFFAAILAGSDMLDGRAAKATLTLSAGFATLNNALTVYFGEADKANGASAAMGEAIGLVAENLDTLIPAIASIAAAMGVRYVGGAVAAAAATRGLTAAMLTLQTVGIAAVIGAIGYLISKQVEAGKEAGRFKDRLDESERALEDARDRARQAGVEIGKLGSLSDSAADGVDKLGRKMQTAAGRAATLAAQLKITALQTAALQRQTAESDLQRIQGMRTPKLTAAVLGKDNAYVKSYEAKFDAQYGGQINALRKEIANIKLREDLIKATPATAFGNASSEGGSITGETEAEKKKRLAAEKKAQREAEKAAREAERASREALQRRQEERADQIEILHAQADLTSSIDDRADLEREMLALERAQRQDELNSRTDLSRQEREVRQKAINDLYGTGGPGKTGPNGEIVVDAGRPGLLAQRVILERREQNARDALDIASAARNSDRDLLEGQARIAANREDRRDLELRLLNLAYQQEEAELRAVIASETASDAQKKIAEERLRILGQLEAYDASDINRQNESPLERRRREVRETAANMGAAIENIELNAIDRLTDGLADASAEFIKLGGIAGDVLNSIIRDTIRLAAQQAIFGSVGGGGGLIGGIGKVLGFSSGGYTGDGPRDQVAGVVHKGEYVVPAQAVKRIGVQNLAAMSNGHAAARGMVNISAARPVQNTIVNQHFTLDARYGITTPQLLQHVENVRQQALGATAAMGQAINKGIPGRMAQFNRDGT